MKPLAIATLGTVLGVGFWVALLEWGPAAKRGVRCWWSGWRPPL